MSDILETTEDGRFRLILEHDPDADPADRQGAGYVFYLEYRHGYDVTTVGDEYDPTGADIVRGKLSEALARFPGDLDTVARYFRTIGCAFDYFDTRDGRYVGIVTPSLGEDWGCEPGTAVPDLTEWQAREEGDVWGYVVEERATWTSNTIGGPRTLETWEIVDDTDAALWGMYGRAYAEETAREAWGHFVDTLQVGELTA